MKPVRRAGGFRWEDVETLAYKSEGERFRDVTRQLLFGPEAGLGCELRYFEVEPGGHSTLEKHRHVHAVVILRGRGRVLIGDRVWHVEPRDLVHVPANTLHQFRPAAEEPLGFLCMVDAERDRPQMPSEDELRALRESPDTAEFFRA
jgi:quercetin dioxygenase-like cupin family protein